MTMAARLQSCLAQHQSRYEVLWHTPSHTSRESARRAGIPPERMAKPVNHRLPIETAETAKAHRG